jgi:hypothetical protein
MKPKMFTDRFIEITVWIYDGEAAKFKDEKECERMPTACKINPFKIESYQQSIPIDLEFEEEGKVCTSIVMESGESHLARMTINEFEKILNAWQKQNQ